MAGLVFSLPRGRPTTVSAFAFSADINLNLMCIGKVMLLLRLSQVIFLIVFHAFHLMLWVRTIIIRLSLAGRGYDFIGVRHHEAARLLVLLIDYFAPSVGVFFLLLI